MNFSKIIILTGLLLASGSAPAFQRITGKVGQIETTYMPARINFTLSEGNAACPAGTTLYWYGDNPDNVKAILATLLTAVATGKNVLFIIDDDDQSCIGKFLYITN